MFGSSPELYLLKMIHIIPKCVQNYPFLARLLESVSHTGRKVSVEASWPNTYFCL